MFWAVIGNQRTRERTEGNHRVKGPQPGTALNVQDHGIQVFCILYTLTMSEERNQNCEKIQVYPVYQSTKRKSQFGEGLQLRAWDCTEFCHQDGQCNVTAEA